MSRTWWTGVHQGLAFLSTVYRVDAAERRSSIEAIHRNIQTLEEEIRAKQITVTRNKANAKRYDDYNTFYMWRNTGLTYVTAFHPRTFSMKANNTLLLQYEQTLKAELEGRKASYNHDLWVHPPVVLHCISYCFVLTTKVFFRNLTRDVHEERLASCRKTFQSHKEYYCKNPLAQKLLTLQAEKEEIEFRIRACDDQITMRQKKLDQLTGNTFFLYPQTLLWWSGNIYHSWCS